MWQLSGPSQIILGDEDLTVVRERCDDVASVVYVDGKAVQRQPVTFTLRANTQPLSGRDLAILPEGELLSDGRWIWASPGEYTLQVGDKVLLNEDWYQIQDAEDWRSYVRARAVRINVGPLTANDFELRPGQG